MDNITSENSEYSYPSLDAHIVKTLVHRSIHTWCIEDNEDIVKSLDTLFIINCS